MPEAGTEQFRSVEEYRRAVDGFYGICGLILFSFAKSELDLKNQIIRDFIARTVMMVRAVMSLWDLNDF
jgi:hypothetical protein